MSKIYDKLRRIRGRPPKKHFILKTNGNEYSTHADIANCLARSFAESSSYRSHSEVFSRQRVVWERSILDFSTPMNEQYNVPFTQRELQSALSAVGNTSPGPDRVHYFMLKNLPDHAQEYLLLLYNKLWSTKYFPPEWRKATIIPIPKPERDHSIPQNYQPIALTSCLCKLFEKMINSRLVEFLENIKLLAHEQCGFRKNRATVDHLVRLDTYIKHLFADGKVTVGVFFDLEKAYDTTWRFGILRDMHALGLRGTLPLYIGEFLRDRRFRVSIDWNLSEEHSQEAGVPQGSILSVTLFAIKINSLARTVPPEITLSGRLTSCIL
jgi:potassium voltage-gated channel Eag-related subfamily H protein 8